MARRPFVSPASWTEEGRPSVVGIPAHTPGQVLDELMFVLDIWETEILAAKFGYQVTSAFSEARAGRKFLAGHFAIKMQQAAGRRIPPARLLVLIHPHNHAALLPEMQRIFDEAPMLPAVNADWSLPLPRGSFDRTKTFEEIFAAKGVAGVVGLARALGSEKKFAHLSRIRSGRDNMPAYDLFAMQRLPGKRVDAGHLIQLLKPENRKRFYPLLVLATASFVESEPPKPIRKFKKPRLGMAINNEPREGSAIFDELRVLLGIKTDVELAEKLGVNVWNIRDIRKGKNYMQGPGVESAQRLVGKLMLPERTAKLIHPFDRPRILPKLQEIFDNAPVRAPAPPPLPPPPPKIVKAKPKPKPQKQPVVEAKVKPIASPPKVSVISAHDIRQSSKAALCARLFIAPEGSTAARLTLQQVADQLRQNSATVKSCFELATAGFSPRTVLEVRTLFRQRGVELTDSDCELICHPEHIEVLQLLLQGKTPTPKRVTPPRKEKERRRRYF